MMLVMMATSKTLERARYVISQPFGSLITHYLPSFLQANYRRTNVATKIRITYVKEKFLDVGCIPSQNILLLIPSHRSRFTTKLVSISIPHWRTADLLDPRGSMGGLLYYQKYHIAIYALPRLFRTNRGRLRRPRVSPNPFPPLSTIQ